MANTRRAFLKGAAMLAAARALGIDPFAPAKAWALGGSSNYKALVCIHLAGGPDCNNMVVPYSANGYANYLSRRGSLALPQSSLLPLNATPDYALHPAMSELQSFYNSGKLAIVCNVGPLTQPTTRAQVQAQSVGLPTNLFSHIDQVNAWHEVVQGSSGQTGWAGRLADLTNGQFNSSGRIPMFVSVSGQSPLGCGAATKQLSFTTSNFGALSCSEGAECDARLETAKKLMKLGSGNSLVNADNDITADAYDSMSQIATAMASASALSTSFPATALGAQLKIIAQLMQVNSSLSMTRQVFFASDSGFDTHSLELNAQVAPLTQFCRAVQAFYAALTELGLQDNVLIYTISEFGRTLEGNANDGTDHGWGGHQFVLGGAVKGGQMYGVYPTLALGGPDDFGDNGRWIPTTASSQYLATMARWFGAPSGQMNAIFPTLSNFGSSDLGFV